MKNNRYCIIMSGGVGSRFWPASRSNKPKQFLDFFGTGRTLIQMTYDRFAQIVPRQNILIVSNASYADLILEQLPEISPEQILLEPIRRNTAPCIAWASYHIRALHPDADIIVAPSDHLVANEAAFIACINKGLAFVAENDDLLTIGITPDRPETGYGYVQVEQAEANGIRKVKAFTEKPDIERARHFVASGDYFWNAGIFMWNVNTIIRALECYLPEVATCFESGNQVYNTPLEHDFIDRHFPLCQNISIDFGIMEKAENVSAICADFGWSDLGTWGSLYELSEKDEQQNAALKCQLNSYKASGNFVSVPGKLVVLQGINDTILVESGNVLLVCKKDDEQQIRQFVADAQQRQGENYI